MGARVTAVRVDMTDSALRRFGSAGEVADLVAFLLSGESCAITGTVQEVRSPIFA
jgi:NAD(P)-dependent dehydrogenase (short-subunit alcohol dehydrogenase family)